MHDRVQQAAHSLIHKTEQSVKHFQIEQGLGLAIAKQIIEETHGGKLSCNYLLGKSTEFVLKIPV